MKGGKERVSNSVSCAIEGFIGWGWGSEGGDGDGATNGRREGKECLT